MSERQKFEWCCADKETTLNDLGEYVNPFIQHRWVGWQACAAYRDGQALTLEQTITYWRERSAVSERQVANLEKMLEAKEIRK